MPEKDARRLRVSVPVALFDSGEPSRDKAVLDILKSKAQPELVFTSKPYGDKEWTNLVAGSVTALDGSLTVAGGMVAKVADELELLYRIPLALIPR